MVTVRILKRRVWKLTLKKKEMKRKKMARNRARGNGNAIVPTTTILKVTVRILKRSLLHQVHLHLKKKRRRKKPMAMVSKSPMELMPKKEDTEECKEEEEKKEKENENDTEKGADDEKEKETEKEEDVKMDDGKPKPRALHKTTSIFLRNLAPTITKQEVKIKEICYSLNNIRLRDFELGPIVNRDLSRRIRTVNGITVDRKVVRNDINWQPKSLPIWIKSGTC